MSDPRGQFSVSFQVGCASLRASRLHLRLGGLSSPHIIPSILARRGTLLAFAGAGEWITAGGLWGTPSRAWGSSWTLLCVAISRGGVSGGRTDVSQADQEERFIPPRWSRHCRYCGVRNGSLGDGAAAEHHPTPVLDSCPFHHNLYQVSPRSFVHQGQALSAASKMSRIYIGNLPLDIKEREIEDLFYKVSSAALFVTALQHG